MEITIYGAGYVGLVSSVCFASMGHTVLCADINQDKIEQLKQGQCPIFEQDLPERLKAEMASGRLGFTSQITEAVQHGSVHFIATGTPSLPNGEADLSQVFSVVEQILREARENILLVTKSTVPVGTGDKIQQEVTKLKDALETSVEIEIASNPEFLREGSAIHDFLNADRIIVGGSEVAHQILQSVYQPLTDKGVPILCMSRASAELSKYASNTMLATRISFMNQISQISECVGADIDDIRQGMALDPRIGPYFLQAGMGYGGSCFPKDSRALIHTAHNLDLDASLFTAVESINQAQKKWAFEKLNYHFKGDLKGKKVALWGLAFKPGTDDMREASSLQLIEDLLKAEVDIEVYDPVAMQEAKRILRDVPTLNWHKSAMSTLRQKVDALVIVTEWDEFKMFPLEDLATVLENAPLIDGRNCFSLDKIKQSKIAFYYSVGRPPLGVQTHSNKDK